MEFYYLIAGVLGAWVFALVMSNQRQQQIWEMEAKIAENAASEQSVR